MLDRHPVHGDHLSLARYDAVACRTIAMVGVGAQHGNCAGPHNHRSHKFYISRKIAATVLWLAVSWGKKTDKEGGDHRCSARPDKRKYEWSR